MKKLSKIIVVMLLTATVSQTSLAAEIPIESAPCNATVESIAITEQLISDELTAVQNGEGYQPAWARANRKIFDAVISKQTNGYGYSDIANIARNALIQYRDMYLRPDYYKAQDEVIYSLIADLIAEVQSGKDCSEALDEAYTRIYHKQYNTLTTLINNTETETIPKLQPLTKYTVLVYETINLGNSTYACYTKVYKLLNNLTIKKETPQFYITNWGRIAKKRILAIVVD